MLSVGAITTSLLISLAWAAAQADSIPIERRSVHPNGLSVVLNTVEFRPDSTVISARISNPGNQPIRLNQDRGLVLEDGSGGIYRVNPPLDNREIEIQPHTELHGTLVFIGPITPSANKLAILSTSKTGDFNAAGSAVSILNSEMPVGQNPREDIAQESRPDGITLRLRQVIRSTTKCIASLLATNGSDNTIVLNQHSDLVLTDKNGVSVPVEPPPENSILVVPFGNRFEGELVFDCKRLDVAGGVTLITNRGARSTSDSTLPVFALKTVVNQTNVGLSVMRSRASVAPIAWSQLSESQLALAPVDRGSNSSALAPASVGAQKRDLVISPPVHSLLQLEAAVRAEKTDRGLRVILYSDKLFDPSAGTLLKETADSDLMIISELLGAQRWQQVVVIGHEDKEQLAKQRANAVSAWLQAHTSQHRPDFVEDVRGRRAGKRQEARIEILLRRR